MMKLILASQSDRRAELLKQVGIDFEIIPGDFDEDSIKIDDPIEFVETLALKKAESIPCTDTERRPILGADTSVVIDGHILGKPRSAEEARKYLRLLSGRAHNVYTGICIYCPWDKRSMVSHKVTTVVMDRLSEEDIEFYIGTKEPFDKAGGYGIQGIGARYIKEIHGDYFNVVGLPIHLVCKMLKQMGETYEKHTKGRSAI